MTGALESPTAVGATRTPAPPADPPPASTPSRAVSVAIGGGALLLYALGPSRNFNYADDALSWAYQLTGTGGIINSHHLFLEPMRWLYRLCNGAGLTINPVTLLALYSAGWGAAGLVVLYRLLVRAGLGTVAVWGTLFCAFSAGYWCYSIIGDVYIPATALMLIGLYFVYAGLRAEQPRAALRCGAAATVSFVAMLAHHQAFAVLVLGLLPAVWLMRKPQAPQRRMMFAVAVPMAVCTLAVALYAAAYASLPEGDRHGFVRFGAGYVDSFEARADQKQLGLGSVINLAAGQTRALVSTNVVFGNPEVAQTIQDRYPYRAVYPFPYLVRDIPFPVAVLLGIGALGTVLATAYLTVRGVWAGCKQRDLGVLMVVPMALQVVFFAWWEGISDEFALWTLPLLAVLVAYGAAATGHPLRWLRPLVGALFVTTLAGSVLLYWNPHNDIDAVNDRYVTSLGGGDVLIGFEDIQSDFRIKLAADTRGFSYLNFFNTGDARDRAEFDAALDAAIRSGARIHVSPRLTHPPESALVFKESLDPTFASGRAALLARLRTVPDIDWLTPAVAPQSYVRLDDGTRTPR